MIGDDMVFLLIGVVLFFGIHVVSSTALKASLVSKFGDNGYKGLFSLVSLVGLILIIVGKVLSEFQFVWAAFPQLSFITLPVMWISFLLLPAAHMKGNIKRITRHPMLWGILLWSTAHLLVNGDLASMVLFGSFGVYAIYAMVSQTQRGAQKQTHRMPLKFDLIVFAAGTLVFVLMIFLHGFLFGVPLR
jgi:uncharacterized membrane protein